MTSIFAGRASTSSISRIPRKPISTPASATRPAEADLHARQREKGRGSGPLCGGGGGGEEGDDGGAGRRGGCITGPEREASIAERMEGGTAGADPMMAARGADRRREAGGGDCGDLASSDGSLSSARGSGG
jgi:hypothetical protein